MSAAWMVLATVEMEKALAVPVMAPPANDPKAATSQVPVVSDIDVIVLPVLSTHVPTLPSAATDSTYSPMVPRLVSNASSFCRVSFSKDCEA